MARGGFIIGLGIFLTLVFLGMIGYLVYLFVEKGDTSSDQKKYAWGGSIGALALGCVGAGFLIRHGMHESKSERVSGNGTQKTGEGG